MGINKYVRAQIFKLHCLEYHLSLLSALHMLIYEMLIFYHYYELCSVVHFAIVPSYHRLIKSPAIQPVK